MFNKSVPHLQFSQVTCIFILLADTIVSFVIRNGLLSTVLQKFALFHQRVRNKLLSRATTFAIFNCLLLIQVFLAVRTLRTSSFVSLLFLCLGAGEVNPTILHSPLTSLYQSDSHHQELYCPCSPVFPNPRVVCSAAHKGCSINHIRMHVCRVFVAPDVWKTKSQEANQNMMGKDSMLPKTKFLWIVFSWTKVAA